MIIKLGTLVKCRKALIKLNNTEGFDSVTAYRILKNARVIDNELKIYDEQQAKLIHMYCERDSKGTPVVKNGYYTIKDENRSKYEKEVHDLFNEDVEINIHKIDINLISKAGLSPAQLELIEFMLIED